jgi:hypothetical protein
MPQGLENTLKSVLEDRDYTDPFFTDETAPEADPDMDMEEAMKMAEAMYARLMEQAMPFIENIIKVQAETQANAFADAFERRILPTILMEVDRRDEEDKKRYEEAHNGQSRPY